MGPVLLLITGGVAPITETPVTSPATSRISTDIVARAAGTDATDEIGEMPGAATITGVSILPAVAVTGDTTNATTLTLYNRGQAGIGTTVLATLALLDGVNLVDSDEKAFTLTATVADRVVAAGDVLELVKTHASSGTAHSGGVVTVEFQRTYA